MGYKRTALITFIYPAAKKYLSALVADLNNQTDKNFTVVVFNDGVEQPEKWLNELRVPHQIIPVEAETPMTIRFEALELLRTMGFEYIIFQDSDDGLNANRVEVVVELLKDYPMVVNDLDIMNETGQVISTNIWKERFEVKPTFSSDDLVSYNFAGLGNTAIHSQLLHATPRQPSKELIAVDWYIFYSILKSTAVVGYRTSRCTTLYRQHSQNSVGQMTPEKRDMAMQVKALHVAAIQAQGMTLPAAMDDKHSKNTNHNYTHPFWWEIAD